MKLNISFNELLATVRKMGITELVDFKVSFESEPPKFEPPNTPEGDRVDLDDVHPHGDDGPLTYKGKQVLLFIPDHGSYFDDAIRDPKKHGRRFHVAECKTLIEMREKNKFQRYHITTNRDGIFEINDGNSQKQNVKLQVCQNCLVTLNYKNFVQNRNLVLAQFSLKEFFQHYETLFKNLPRENYQGEVGYADNWPEISRSYRASRHYCCEKCGVNLSKYPHLLHVHHQDGVKRNNSPTNLIALCKQCHINEPDHQHMEIALQESLLLQNLRIQQGIFR